jgi:hypothetical protein
MDDRGRRPANQAMSLAAYTSSIERLGAASSGPERSGGKGAPQSAAQRANWIGSAARPLHLGLTTVEEVLALCA